MGVEKQCDYYSEQYGCGGCCPRGRLLILFHVRVGPHAPPALQGEQRPSVVGHHPVLMREALRPWSGGLVVCLLRFSPKRASPGSKGTQDQPEHGCGRGSLGDSRTHPWAGRPRGHTWHLPWSCGLREASAVGTAPGSGWCCSSPEADSRWGVWFGNLALLRKEGDSPHGSWAVV